MSEPDSNGGGIIASLRQLIDSGLAMAHDRVRLFAVELRLEQCRMVEALLLASTLVAVGMLTVTLLTLLVRSEERRVGKECRL